MNFLKDEFSQYFERATKIQIDITNKCNFDCVYCYNKNSDFLKNKELNDEQLMLLVDKVITEINPVVVSFSGGEALLRKDVLIKAIKKMKENDIISWLTTNISLLDEKIAYELKDAGLDNIFTNIDSNIEEVHDNLRGKKGGLAKSIKTIKQLVKIFGGNNVIGTSVITKNNYKNIVPAIRKTKELGVNKFHLIDFIPISTETKELMLSKENWLELKKEIEESHIQQDINLQLCHSFLFMSDEYKKMDFPFCMAGRFTMVITACGDIVPCNHLKKQEFFCGNALTENLLKIWQESEIFKKFRYYDYSDNSCNKCKRFKKCAGGCKAMAYVLKGNAFETDPYCQEFNSDEL